jgi:valyl-tRNA synthetase
MPYITEELWHHLPHRPSPESIMLAKYPSSELAQYLNPEIEQKAEVK